jgi:hypothetical protein
MATYTNLGIKQITTGDESGTWGDSTNTNFDYFDTAIVGYVSVTLASAGSSGSPNTLNVADFAASNGRNRIVEFVDAGDLGGTAYVQITPNDFEGYYFIRNGLSGSRSILLFQGTYDAARDYEIPNGKDIVVRCSGGGSTSYIYNVLENLQVGNLSASSLTASTALALDSSKNVISVTNTGTGNNVLATSPTLVTPVLGTPTSGTLTNCTGLPVSTGISGLGANVATFLATPSSANLIAAVSDETGTGSLVFATSPTLVTPVLGTPTSGTLTNCTGLPVSTGISGFGTGVATALAVNVGSSGAFVTNGGALGTPSSGTVTNLTGTASININGTVGATTRNTGSFISVTTNYADRAYNGAFLENSQLASVNIPKDHRSFGTAVSLTDASTLTSYTGLIVEGVNILAGGTVTTQYGVQVLSSLSSATTNYGVYSNIAVSGTSRYNFYAAGTAPNYFGGSTVISVTDNTNAALRVTQLGTGNALEIEDTTNPDSSPFVVDANGVLIKGRSTTVSTKVLATAGTLDVQVHGTGAATSSMGLFNYANNATFPSFLVFNKSKSGTSGTLSAVTDGDNLGLIQFNGADSDATSTFNPGAYISAQVAGAVAASSIPARLNFSTTAVGATTPVTTVQIASTGLTVTRDAAGLGYGTGSGGAVTQATNRTTGVTLNKANGAITLVSAAGTATWQSFTVTNSTVAATDVVILSQKSGTDLYMLEVTAVAAGSFRISFATTGGTTTEQPVFNFAVIKAVAA